MNFLKLGRFFDKKNFLPVQNKEAQEKKIPKNQKILDNFFGRIF